MFLCHLGNRMTLCRCGLVGSVPGPPAVIRLFAGHIAVQSHRSAYRVTHTPQSPKFHIPDIAPSEGHFWHSSHCSRMNEVTMPWAPRMWTLRMWALTAYSDVQDNEVTMVEMHHGPLTKDYGKGCGASCRRVMELHCTFSMAPVT